MAGFMCGVLGFMMISAALTVANVVFHEYQESIKK